MLVCSCYVLCSCIIDSPEEGAKRVTMLVPIKGVEEQLNVCNHVACWHCSLLTLGTNTSLKCNFCNLTLHADLDLKHYKFGNEDFTIMNERWLQLLHFLCSSCHVLMSLRYPLMFG